MKRQMSVAVIGLAIAMGGAPAFAASYESQAADAAARQRKAVTIYVDANWGNRTNGAARHLNDVHAAFAKHGYVLVDVELYSENQDLLGFFVSYVRDAAQQTAGG